MTLKIELLQDQIDAAGWLHKRLEQWQISDAALARLRSAVPGFDGEACLLKTVAVNALYSTQVMALVRMGRHVESVLAKTNMADVGPELVEMIAALPPESGETKRSFVSFAAKFCHFFVDEDRFPIYDEAVRKALRLHLGDELYEASEQSLYRSLCVNLSRLRQEARLTGHARDLDRYLWLTGMYMKWLDERAKEKPEINVELRRLFEQPEAEAVTQLDRMLPANLKRVFVRRA